MSGVGRVAAAAGALVAALAGVVAIDQGSGSAAPAVPAAVTPVSLAPFTGSSMVEPRVGALSTSPYGTVYVSGQTGGPLRSTLFHSLGTRIDLGEVSGPDGFAGIQGAVVAAPTATTVAFRGVGALPDQPLGTVPLAAGDRYLGQADRAALVAVPGTGGSQLVRRPIGAADVPIGGAARFQSVRTLESDAAGALLRLQDGAGYTLRYLNHADNALTTLTALPASGDVQGTVLDAARVGWIAGATLSTAPRTAPATVTTSTLPVADAEFVSGSTAGSLRYDPTDQLTHVLLRPAGATTSSDVARLVRTVTGSWRRAAAVVPSGSGGVLTPTVSTTAGVALVRTGTDFATTVTTLPRVPATVRQLSISGGRLAYVDDVRSAGTAHSEQLALVDGSPSPRVYPTDLGSYLTGQQGAARTLARGSRTVLVRNDGAVETYGGSSKAVTVRSVLPAGAELVGMDGRYLVYRDAAGHQLLDLRFGAPVAVPPTDVDGGARWSATAVTGEVQRRQYGTAAVTTVVAPDPTCAIQAVEARQGDVLVRCASGEGRVYGPGGGAPLLRFPADASARLGSGVLWRVTGGMLTATAYRTPGATPVEMFAVGGAPWAVDREGPWAVRYDPATRRVQAAVVPGIAVPPAAGRYLPRTPYRLLDTRKTGGAVLAGVDRTVTVPAHATGATNVVVSVTVTAPTAASWLAVFPSGRYTGSSTVNFAAGQTVTTQTVVPLGSPGVDLRVGAGSAQVVLDVVGEHVEVDSVDSAEHVPVPPARILDTRPGDPLAAGAPRTVDLSAAPGVATAPWAMVLNVTVTNASAASYLSVSGAGGTVPTTLSFPAGRTTASMAVVTPAAGKAVLTLGGGTADVLLDIAGYVPSYQLIDDDRQVDLFTPDAVRLLDTRTGTGQPVAVGADRRVQVTGVAGVPRGTRAVLLTVTATRPTAASHVTAYPTGTTPTTSTLNFAAGQTVANSALVPLAADGSIALRVGAGTSHVLLDVLGYLTR